MVKKYKFFLLLSVCTAAVWILLCMGAKIALPSQEKPLLLYSNHCRCDLHKVLYKALSRAHTSLFLEIYALSDPTMIALFHEKRAQGASLTILHDKTATAPLKMQGAHPVSCEGLMHRKIAVIDEELVFLGSMNFTTQSLTLHDNLLAGLYSPPLAKHIVSGATTPYFFSGGEFWCLPDDGDKSALKRLVCMLQGAKKSIRVAMFTLTHPDLIQALIQASCSGVRVEVALDRYTAEGASKAAMQQLANAGVSLYLSQGQQLFHHKWTWIDDKSLILGSTNWTRSAFKKNMDCYLLLDPLPEEQIQFMKRLWTVIMHSCSGT